LAADVNELVRGGDYGSPFSIGDYGFFAENQIGAQNKILIDDVNDQMKGRFITNKGNNDYLSSFSMLLVIY
jgi:hypothetical protein